MSPDLLDLLLEKLASARKTVLLLAAAVLLFACVDTVVGARKTAALDAQFADMRALTLKAQDIGGRLRYMLHNLYTQRELSERQKLTLLVYDLRRVRRALDAVQQSLLSYREPLLPDTTGPVSRISLQAQLKPVTDLANFYQPPPGSESPMAGRMPFLDVSINDIRGDLTVSQLPIDQLGVLLIGAEVHPERVAAVLEEFVEATKRAPSAQALAHLSNGLEEARQPFAAEGNTEHALAFLDEVLARGYLRCGRQDDLDQCVQQAKHLSLTTESLETWLQELVVSFAAEEKRRRGDNDVTLPGAPAPIPVWLAMAVFWLAVVYGHVRLWPLVWRARQMQPGADALETALALKHGELALAYAGYVNPSRRLAGIAASALVMLAAWSFVVMLYLSRSGGWQVQVAAVGAVVATLFEAALLFVCFGRRVSWRRFV